MEGKNTGESYVFNLQLAIISYIISNFNFPTAYKVIVKLFAHVSFNMKTLSKPNF